MYFIKDRLDKDNKPSLLLILKWGGELTTDGKGQAEDLGAAFRKKKIANSV